MNLPTVTEEPEEEEEEERNQIEKLWKKKKSRSMRAHIEHYVMHQQVGDDIQNLDIVSMCKGGKNERISLGLELLRHRKSGEVVNSHCECAAGIGPHGTCKHVVSALLTMEIFVSYGILYISKSSTETLRTFKSPRKLYGREPVVDINNHDDPRPERFLNRLEFVDKFKMTILNSQLNTSWKYSFGSASLKAAIFDHDYLAQPFTHY
ncbi:unnamed protein product [Lepeophtheirus salmonis]|uniref:(salmon louse) hypothetical protein n=1 Tax=Lepeophtheirus salmonis TaxID=72036 RepID=A0A7R8CWQ4_LEPSM|nr:unnamed protein product [Lepeophtheirus salmonis]CAF2955295.1 unnamed protein product [Lepeophtheirus salmonis]